MEKIKKLLTVVVVGSFFICAQFCFSANADIIINEIGAHEPNDGGYEWIEIWNKGVAPVNLAGWKFWENNTNHGLTASTTDSIVEAGEYAVICQDLTQFTVQHPAFSGSVFDSSWSSLRESGEEIGLKDNEGNFLEQFIYVTTTNFSLERKNPFLSVYDVSNWQEHLSGDTVGFINSNFSTSTIDTAPTTTLDTPTTTPLGLILSADTSTIWAQIKINEFVSDPESGNEWVELYNPSTSSLDLFGGWICDLRGATSTYACKITTGTISAGGWLSVDLNSGSYLNNDGDSVILKNPAGDTVDSIDYVDSSAPNKGQSLARKIDGIDAENLSDWAITVLPTLAAANIIVAPAPIIHQSSGGGSSVLQTLQTPVAEQSGRISSGAVINELFPNPSGSDITGEFIEIKNISNSTIDLVGWKIADAAKTFELSGVVLPGQLISWPRTLTKISLNNTTKETVKLFNEKGETVDLIEYNSAKEGESFCRGTDAKWLWSSKPTSGKENEIIIQSDGEIILKINAPSGGEVGEMLVFDAEDSADRRGGELNFIWRFSDGMILTGGEIERAFSTSGVFAILLSATSTSGSSGAQTSEVIIGNGLSVNNTGIIFSEILPNPVGDDFGEFIEIYNSGDTLIDLVGWRLRRQNGQEYIFPTNTLIQPDGYLVFGRAAARFSLNNQGDKVELLTRDSQIVDLVKFGPGPAGKSYSLFDDEWQWTSAITDGQINQSAKDLENELQIASQINEAEFFLTLADIRPLEVGKKVRTRGTVSVLPGIFGSQFFYLSDESGGIQIYNYKKDFPPLKIGDYLEVFGEISVSQNVKRIKIKDNQSIDILELGKILSAPTVELSDIQEDQLGGLIKIFGEITEIKTNGMYIDDGQDEILVYFKKGAKINKKLFQEGELVSVVGILEEKSGEWQLWPRNVDDIQSAGLSETLLAKEALAASGDSQKKASDYLTATIGGLTALLLGFVGRARGALLKTVAKKTGALVLGAVFKRKV